MSRKVYIYFALTFILGVVVGACGLYFFGWNTGRWHPRPSPDRFVQYMRKELNLSDGQVAQIRQIVNDTRTKFHELEKQMEPQFDAVRDESRAHIRQVLNPQQAQKFDQMVRRWEERRRKRHRR